MTWWIRIDTDIGESMKIAQFRDRISTPDHRVSLPEAVGHAVLVWAWVGEKQFDGKLNGVPNENIESAARWQGEPEVLALAFRDVFCDGRGRIKGWEERQGKLVALRRKNAQRMRAARHK